MMRCAIILFMKPPVRGRVKTRIAAETGDDFALALYRILLERTFTTLSSSGFATIFAISDKDTEFSVPAELNSSEKEEIIQHGDDLGERMFNAFSEAFSMGYERCAITGSDIPGLSAQLIHKAFSTLDHADYSISPAADGGYCILSMKRDALDMGIFRGIQWSTGTVLEETVKRIKDSGRSHILLPGLRDIDTADDLKEFLKDHGSDSKDRLVVFLKENLEVLNGKI